MVCELYLNKDVKKQRYKVGRIKIYNMYNQSSKSRREEKMGQMQNLERILQNIYEIPIHRFRGQTNPKKDNFFSNHLMWYSETAAAAAAAAAAKSLQSCPTLCDPIDGSPPGSPSLGFSRQEHCSGLPFPSPMHESEKRK